MLLFACRDACGHRIHELWRTLVRVLFIRHAAAADRAMFGGSDLERTLTDEGRKEARAMFKALAALYPEPNLVISSAAVRARETAEIFSSCFAKAKLAESKLLNPGSGFREFRKLVAELSGKPDFIVVVGHEPDFSHILGHITADGGLRIDVKKASCIEVDINSVCKGELKALLTPKAVAKLLR
jgi:phosphohistidine phosphatase